jgi:hypothetical protein
MSHWCTTPLALLCLVAVPTVAQQAPLLFEASRHSQAVTECDRLAGHAEDPNKVTPGVPEARVDLPAAIAACRADLAGDPGNPRLQYQLGRALSYAARSTRRSATSTAQPRWPIPRPSSCSATCCSTVA